MTRQLVLDTETTGLDCEGGDRVIEIAAVEIVNLMPTGRQYHALLDPEREVPAEATRVHGFTTEFLRGRSRFADVVDELLAFLGDAPIIAHNAAFDFGFLDAELRRCGRPPLDRTRMVCSLELAKRRYPGLPNGLDALCRRLGVDNSMRTTHNALLDVKLLAEVFLELSGGRQPGLDMAAAIAVPRIALASHPVARRPVLVLPTPAELAAHAAFVARLKDPLWTAAEADAPSQAA